MVMEWFACGFESGCYMGNSLTTVAYGAGKKLRFMVLEIRYQTLNPKP